MKHFEINSTYLTRVKETYCFYLYIDSESSYLHDKCPILGEIIHIDRDYLAEIFITQ